MSASAPTSPTQRLQVGTSGDGTVALANAWNTFSDIRLKRDLAVIPMRLINCLSFMVTITSGRMDQTKIVRLG